MTEAVWDPCFASAVLPATMEDCFIRSEQLRPSMSDSELLDRYRDLLAYVGWTYEDAARVRRFAGNINERLDVLVDDFYAEIERHPDTARVITGGPGQIEHLKVSLEAWLRESLECRCDKGYVTRRWNIGLRHAEIGLNPAYTSAALSRLRNGIVSIIAESHHASPADACELVKSFNKLLDLDLAIIQDAYQGEYLKRAKRAEHERSEVKFRMLVEAAGCMVIILRPDHSVAYFSPFSEDLTGYSSSEVAGRDFLKLLIPQWARQDVAREIDRTFAGRPTTAYETPMLCRDGRQRWLVWNAQRLEEYDTGSAVLAVGHDFTERREAQEKLLRAERLAGIGQMVTGLAHESRNALQRIQSCCEMLELETEGNEQALQLVHRLQEAQDNLLRLFEEVRGFAAPIHLECTSCRLESTWREAWQLLETIRRDRTASLVENVHTANLTASVDRFRLVQLFRNLFENALAACQDPVVVQLDCRDVQLGERPAVEVRVRDNGPGLTPEAQESVFEPFFTTKTKGSGLGMAIAHRIVEAHGGRIALGEEWSKGAEFVVTLPRTSP